ncbi:MAG: ABC transporter permease [Oscillospiraceae bacterium]|nr:ABC transporter permease [Oscillospiraceae bacterium]
MRAGFYPRLALDGIRKNKKLYVPFGLTCVGMIMMTYIIGFLRSTPVLDDTVGIDTVRTLLTLGMWVMIIFSCIFLFYTNSFLIRRRKKEFGLYNILGMGKGNLGVILFWETLLLLAASLVIGLGLGIAFSKLAELLLLNIVHSSVSYTLSVSGKALAMTAALFGAIFALLYGNALRQVKFSTAIALIKSEAVGEKPPKGNWVLGLLGLVILAAAYYIAVTIKDPISAMLWFFIAVIMVIVATYLLMIAGSVLFCRILQKKKNYYYKPNHFVSVSSMVYRMKRNGAGLASICILATMVLVMISTTSCLYAGSERALLTRYPGQINLTAYYETFSDSALAEADAIRETVEQTAARAGTPVKPVNDYFRVSVAGVLEGNVLDTDPSRTDFNLSTYSDIVNVVFLRLTDYNAATGAQETLADGEAMLYPVRCRYQEDTIGFVGGRTLTITRQLSDIFCKGDSLAEVLPVLYLVVPDQEAAIRGLDEQADLSGARSWVFDFDTELKGEAQKAFFQDLLSSLTGAEHRESHLIFENREGNKEEFYGFYGGLFYLGIILSLVFILAAVLIIYYKQISEGYEDQARFAIMQNVGMTEPEIRRSINSQLLTVFFLPLLGAGLHLAFAFPMIRKMLMLLNLTNIRLFALTTVISFVVFALFYVLVYRITSNAYFHIVRGTRSRG